jgi:NADPH-dependent glutamate synthase beta subunit-like oxidoreductase
MKKSMNSFERMFQENQSNERVQLFGNVDINKDLSYDELCTEYEAVILAYGASKARRLGLANENVGNCLSGKDFVSWFVQSMN